MIGITPIRPFRGIISRVTSAVIVVSKYHEPSSTVESRSPRSTWSSIGASGVSGLGEGGGGGGGGGRLKSLLPPAQF